MRNCCECNQKDDDSKDVQGNDEYNDEDANVEDEEERGGGEKKEHDKTKGVSTSEWAIEKETY